MSFNQNVLNHLKSFRYPHFVEEIIRKRLVRTVLPDEKESKRSPFHCYTRFIGYPEKLKLLEEIRERKDKGKSNTINLLISIPKTENEIKNVMVEVENKIRNVKTEERKRKDKYTVGISCDLPRIDDEIKKLAFNTSLYFSQGYEILKTAITMDINSSPIMDYYSLLQIVKGVILLELDVDKKEFFKSHGLRSVKKIESEVIHQAKIETYGVFPALLIRCGDYVKDHHLAINLEDYYVDNYSPTFKEMIERDHLRSLYKIPEAFIFSWMLSEIVRYKPEEWQKICTGTDNNWIRNIEKFRESILPNVIMDLTTYLLTK
jgi:hypothetical protein